MQIEAAPSRRWPWWLAVVALALATGGAWWFHSPALPPALPANPTALEPLLREYVAERVEQVRQQPRDANRHATLGLVYSANGLWTEARACFQNTVVMTGGREPLPRLYAAIATQECGEAEPALAMFREVARDFPSFAPGFYRLGEALLQKNDLEGAEASFHRLTELAPEEWRGHAALGIIRFRQGKAGEAVPLLEKAVALDPGAKSAHHQLGQAYQALGRVEEARRELALGANAKTYPMPDGWSVLAPKHMRLIPDLVEMAEEFAAQGEPAKSVAILRSLVASYPTNFSLLNSLGIAWSQAGKPREAHGCFENAARLDPRYAPAHVGLSLTAQALGRPQEALAFAGQAISLAPQLPQAHLAKGNALLGLERDAEAREALLEAARLDPRNDAIQVEIGNVTWHNLRQPETARAFYLKAVELNPASRPAHIRLVELALEGRRWNEAKATLATLRSLAPGDPSIDVMAKRVEELQRR